MDDCLHPLLLSSLQSRAMMTNGRIGRVVVMSAWLSRVGLIIPHRLELGDWHDAELALSMLSKGQY